MIRFPKRNVAQPIQKKPKKPAEIAIQEQEENHVEVKKPVCPAKWSDRLYPSELWQLHDDLDTMAYRRGQLSPKEREELSKRLPSTLSQAEADADKRLFDFVQDAINTTGIVQYSNMLKQAMTPDAQLMLALRCYAAATSGERIRDTIKIFSHKTMNSLDFFPESCRRMGRDPRTGRSMPYVVDRADSEDNPYWRAQNHSIKQRMRRQITTDPEPTQRDRLPPHMLGQISQVLSGFGINVQSNKEAWTLLSDISKGAQVEDRIVARIAYLIMNATVHKDNRLGGHSRKLLP
jgi:hypothetical protein